MGLPLFIPGDGSVKNHTIYLVPFHGNGRRGMVLLLAAEETVMKPSLSPRGSLQPPPKSPDVS